MARIVGVHGIGNTYRTGAELDASWLHALQGGLYEAGGAPLAAGDVRVVSYGALFRPGPDGEERPPNRLPAQQPFEPQAAWESELVEAWWDAAAGLSAQSRASGSDEDGAEDPLIQPPDFPGRVRAPGGLQRALLQLAKSRFFRACGPALLISELRQVRLFLHDAAFRRAILERVTAQIGPDTRLVIGHSLGSVVAYEVLCANPQWGIDHFVTLGSPLGIPNLVHAGAGPHPRPPVRHWTNIADQGDLVALQKRLDGRFGAVTDLLVYNGWHSHDVGRYLSAAETGRAVAAALADPAAR